MDKPKKRKEKIFRNFLTPSSFLSNLRISFFFFSHKKNLIRNKNKCSNFLTSFRHKEYKNFHKQDSTEKNWEKFFWSYKSLVIIPLVLLNSLPQISGMAGG